MTVRNFEVLNGQARELEDRIAENVELLLK
jgi:hypothetical protein